MALFSLEGQTHKERLQHTALVAGWAPSGPTQMESCSPEWEVPYAAGVFWETVCVLAKNMGAGCLGFQSQYGHLLCDFE